MPRIDPVQLLKCLEVLLAPTGGIKSKDEVQRLASLMHKFSKKLVSKCIYIQILKSTETNLMDLFMASGGWKLVHAWLTESIAGNNWPLVREMLELLLLCPVDIDRLKANNCPKIVKELSKDENYFAIRALASKLVEQWLKIVKGEQATLVNISDIPKILADAAPKQNNTSPMTTENIQNVQNCSNTIKMETDQNEIKTESDLNNDHACMNGETEPVDPKLAKVEEDSSKTVTNSCPENESEVLPVLKITVKDGKQIVSQVDDSETKPKEKISIKDKSSSHKSKSTERRSSSSSDSKSKSSSKHASRSSSSSRHKSGHRSPSKHSSDKSKDKSRHSDSSNSKSDHIKKSNESSSSSNDRSSKHRNDSKNSSKENRSKGKDKDEKSNKDDSAKTLQSIKSSQPSIHKLGKIPKLSDSKKEKPSISIEVRKPDDPKPKTVKTFNSKFRKHGLEEEIKPPPSRAAILSKKVVPPVPPTVVLPKRPSPVHNDTPPEKKSKTVDVFDKPGAIKLIPAKPKPMLLESDMFMDALNASATTKKEPKKRKRRISGSKDTSESSPPHTPTTPPSPSQESKSVPMRFYQDTLDTEEEKEKTTLPDSESPSSPKEESEVMDSSEPVTLTVNGLKGILCYHKRKGQKKNIKWKSDLEEVQYFELDETERVNVTKTFTDMKHLERINERDAFQKARNLSNDDVMEEKTTWKVLIPIDCDGQIVVDYGNKSKEREIQAMRQKGTLQPLYFHKSMIPDSPFEADIETHQYIEPSFIPLEDITGNQDNVHDFRNMPWPEPKGNAPPGSNNSVPIPQMFAPPMSQFPNNFQNSPFGMPGFPGPIGMPPQMMPQGMPPNMVPAPVAMPGNMPPGVNPALMMPPENMMMGPGPDMFNGPKPMFPMSDNFNMNNMNMQPNMFPPDFNMGQSMPGPDGVNGPNFRGNMRGRGGPAGNWRGKGNWEGPPRGRGGLNRGRKTPCIYFQRKGSCRLGDSCGFLHPGVNGPF